MKSVSILGVVLIVIGLAALAWPVIRYTTSETVVDVGPLEVNRERTRSIPVPPLLGGAAAVVGVVLLISGARSRG